MLKLGTYPPAKIQSSHLNYSFNIQLFFELFWALTTSGQWHRPLLVKNMAATRMPATENRSLWRWHKAPLRCGVWLSKVSWLGSWKNWPDFPDERGWGNCGAAYCRCRSNGGACFVYPGIPRDSSSNINAYDKETLDNLSPAFSDVDQPCSNV